MNNHQPPQFSGCLVVVSQRQSTDSPRQVSWVQSSAAVRLVTFLYFCLGTRLLLPVLSLQPSASQRLICRTLCLSTQTKVRSFNEAYKHLLYRNNLLLSRKQGKQLCSVGSGRISVLSVTLRIAIYSSACV